MMERVLRIVGLDPNSTRTKLHDTTASDLKILDNDPNHSRANNLGTTDQLSALYPTST
jgi:hypothetical protein